MSAGVTTPRYTPLPADRAPAEVEQEHARLQSYAARHRLLVVASNYGGPTGSLPSGVPPHSS